MTDQTVNPSPDEVADLQDDAHSLEDQAERDGVLPDEDDIPEEGVGPQTGAVP